MKCRHIVFAAALCAGGLSLSTHAGTIGLQFAGMGAQQKIEINYTGNAPSGNYFQGGTTMHEVKAGVLNYNVMSVSGAAADYFSVGNTIQTFCADIFQAASQSSGENWKTVTFGNLANAPEPASDDGPMGADRAALVSVLFAQNFLTAVGGSNVQAAAFQLALWEIIHEESATVDVADFADTGYGVTDGVFFASSNANAQTLASAWLEDAWDDWRKGAAGMSLMGAYGDDFQDVILIIPLPAPVLMAGLGLLAVPLLRRRVAKEA